MYLHFSDSDSAARLFGVAIPGGLDVVDDNLHLLANQLFPKEFPGLEHPWDIIEWPEVLGTRRRFAIFAKRAFFAWWWPNTTEEDLLRLAVGHTHDDGVGAGDFDDSTGQFL